MSYEFPTSRTTFLWRGLTLACPRCGDRHIHKNYFSIVRNCPTCDLKFEKEHGYWTGALAFNFVMTGSIVILALAVGLIATAPDIAVVPVIIILVPLAVLLPIIFYPFTHTVWMAIDYGFLSRLDND
jgi:uncharacterized protein (DUF983 family)